MSKNVSDSTPCTHVKMETTPTKVKFSSKQKLEKYQPNVEKMELTSPAKPDCSSVLNRNCTIQKQETLTAAHKGHTSVRAELSDFNLQEIPLVFSNDALTDIVLQVNSCLSVNCSPTAVSQFYNHWTPYHPHTDTSAVVPLTDN